MSADALTTLIRIGLAVAIFALARAIGLNRDRALYTIMLIVVASYYALNAMIGGSMAALAMELIAISAFVAVALLGFPNHPWLIAAGLAAHGLFESVHAHFIANSGVPSWWPAFCLTFDLMTAVFGAAMHFPTRKLSEASCANR